MKRKDIEKLIRQDFHTQIEPLNHDIRLEDYLGENSSIASLHRSGFGFHLARGGIFVLVLVIVFLFAITISVGLRPGLITTTTTTTDSSATQILVTNPVTELSAIEYANPIITASKLAYTVSLSGTIPLGLFLDDVPLLIDDEMILLNSYINALESTLFQPLGYTVEIKESDNPSYMFMMESVGVNLLAEIETYYLYYNVDSSIGNQTELSGIVVKNGGTSMFEGILIKDGEESLFTFTAYGSSLTSGNYVITEFYADDDLLEYHMNVFQNNQMISSSDLTFSVEEDETKIKVKVEKGFIEMEFEIEKELDEGIEKIKIDYSIKDGDSEEEGEIKVKVLTDSVTGKVSYQYDIKTDGKEKSQQEDRYDDEDDEDEDEDDEEEHDDTNLIFFPDLINRL